MRTNSLSKPMLDVIPNSQSGEVYPYLETPLSHKNKKTMLQEFKDNLALAGTIWYDVSNICEVVPLIRLQHPEADIICSGTPEIKGSKNLQVISNPYDLANLDVAIIRAKFGVIETGMMWITESNIRINSIDQFTKHLVILLHPEDLVKDMQEAYEDIYMNENSYGSFISSPSTFYTKKVSANIHSQRTLTVIFI